MQIFDRLGPQPARYEDVQKPMTGEGEMANEDTDFGAKSHD